nr:MAG TPA: hypothetical protein [Bacteriophage sp.]DAL09842.1 MAG TPA_asm: hypothetical protein [Caudoviricetes sp.]DAL58103.1 MAG TPA_asm: hypothetical protein [Bacteriophage sp.]
MRRDAVKQVNSALTVVVMRLCARDEANKFLFQLLK